MYRYAILGLFFAAAFSGCGDNSNNNAYTSVVEGTAIQVPALTGGKILEIRVDTGEEVEAGAVLAVIDTLELVYQRQQLQASLEEVEIQRRIAQAAYEQAQTNVDYLSEKHQRIARLYKNNSTSRQTLDDLTNQLKQVRTALETAQQNFQTIEAKRKQLAAQMNMVLKKLKDMVIIAPAGGIVTEKYFEPGEAVPPANPIVEIIDVRQVDVKIYVSETKLPEINYGQDARILIDGTEKELTGTVSWVSPKAEFTPKSIMTPETRTSLVYAVKVTVPNPEGILKHGMPVEVLLAKN